MQEEGHLSYKCPKNILGERDPPPKKKRKGKPKEEDSDSDFDGDKVVVIKKPAR